MANCFECLHFDVCRRDFDRCMGFLDKSQHVKVVRCKDCKYLTRLTRGGYGYALQCGYRGHLTYENDYCAGGRRRATNEAD